MNQSEFKYGHALFTNKDSDAPDVIKDSNGDVVLDLCKKCHRGEAELDEVCPNFAENRDESAFSTLDVGSVEEGAPRVRLKWFTQNGDALLGHMARVSNPKATEADPADRLIGYLLRNHHWSPFEMVNLCVEVHTERDISAQIFRHWSLKFQEFSTRYAEVEDLRWSTELRFQDHKNRQNSFDVSDMHETVNGYPVAETVEYFGDSIHKTRVTSLEIYTSLLKRGVAKEVARRFLPFGFIPTVMYINGNLRSWITYIMERTKPGVQKEHRDIALAVEPVFAECFPAVWSAVLEARRMYEDREKAQTNGFDVENMFNVFCGVPWQERYPDSTLAEAISLNLNGTPIH